MRKKQKLNPAGFLSYVHFDDKHENGKISELRDRLSAEVRAQTGEEFPIFQDRNDIHWGENWQQRIEKSLNTSTFFIPILTPSFFKSPACRKEAAQFLQREKSVKKDNLIFPIYYIELPEINSDSRNNDRLLKSILSHQYMDWRELRFEVSTSSLVSKKIAHLATEILYSLSRQREHKKETSIKVATPVDSNLIRNETEQVVVLTSISTNPGAKSEICTHIVDSTKKEGAYSTISAAITNANSGDRILIRPGEYQEHLLIDKSLEIIGDGPGEIVIQARDGDLVVFKSSMGRLSNLTFRQMGHGNCIDIVQGRPEIEDCDIACDNGVGVVIRAGSNPRLRRNRIHGAGKVGVLVTQDAQGILEENDIKALAVAGISVTAGGNPIIRGNQIHDGTGNGIQIAHKGLGDFQDNDIFGTEMTAVIIRDESSPIFRLNRIYGSKVNGVRIDYGGFGTFEENEIKDNQLAGVEIINDSRATMRKNSIIRNEVAIRVSNRSGGIFEDNDLRDNITGPWDIAEDSQQHITKKKNAEMK